MQNALAYTPIKQWAAVAAMLTTIFVQETKAEAQAAGRSLPKKSSGAPTSSGSFPTSAPSSSRSALMLETNDEWAVARRSMSLETLAASPTIPLSGCPPWPPDPRHRGLKPETKLAIGDGALGFWTALREVFATMRKSAAGSTRP